MQNNPQITQMGADEIRDKDTYGCNWSCNESS